MILFDYFEKVCSIDFEVLSSYWLCGVRDLQGKIVYEICCDDENILEAIIQLKRRTLLYGYNIKAYDLKILTAIELGATIEEVYLLSQHLICDSTIRDIQITPAFKKLEKEEQIETINNIKNDFGILNKEIKYANIPFYSRYNYTDLFDDNKGSLKEHMANMGMEILEANDLFEKEFLDEEDFEQLKIYNRNDTLASEKLLYRRMKYIEAKINIAIQFNINVIDALKCTDAQLVAKVLYAQKNYQPYNNILTFNGNVDKILRLHIPEQLYNRYLDLKSKNNTFKLFENEVKFGVGGIHSVYSDDIIVKAKEGYIIVLADYGSFYTTMIKFFNYHSRNISAAAAAQFNGIHDTRLLWKNRPDLVDEKKLTVYKDLLNIYSGALRQRVSALYDLQMGDSLCRTGQLILTAFSNALYKVGIMIIQTNTDGIMLRIPNSKVSDFNAIVSVFEKLIDGQIGLTYIDTLIQDNVNNYILKDIKGKIKLKGNFAKQANYTEETGGDKNLLAPVVHKALVAYFISGTPVEETINKSTSIFDFCLVCKHGSTFVSTVHGYKGQYFKQQKVNRCIATTNKDYTTLYKIKRKTGNWEKIANIPDNAKILNKDLSEYNIDNIELDRQWYIDRANRKKAGFRYV